MKRLAAALCLALALLPGIASAGEGGYVPTRWGGQLSWGDSYSPGGVDFLLVTGFALLDYDLVWKHRAPESLRFKLEGSAGFLTRPETCLVLSTAALAQRYLPALGTARVVPYWEGGVGVIYTDYRAEGQGLRFNFNPQIGVGVEVRPPGGRPWFASLRLHHWSNGNVDDDNRGVSSLLLSVGWYF